MKPEMEMTTLIQYRVDRARESIEEAKLLLENGHLHSSVNRRQKGDYDDLVTFLPVDIEAWVGEVKTFVAAISDVIRKWEGNDTEIAMC